MPNNVKGISKSQKGNRLFRQPRLCSNCENITKNKYCEVCGNKCQ